MQPARRKRRKATPMGWQRYKRFLDRRTAAPAAWLAMLATSISLGASPPAHAGDWSAQEKHLLVGALTLHACDWVQTRDIARNQARYYESNPLLGESPSSARVNNYFAGTAIATTLAAHLLPRYRRAILTGALVIESSAVVRNQSIGVSIKF
jgi:hypothetical protein